MSEEIRGLMTRYCELMDGGDFDGVGALFSFGRLADQKGNEIARGADGVAAFYRSSVVLYEGSPRTKHLVLNSILEEGDGLVIARSSYLVLQALDDFPLQAIITGRYVDQFVQDHEGNWCFSERRFFADLVGDLSRHLRYEI